MNNRNYNEEIKDTRDHKYAYTFESDVMHNYMIESFEPFFMIANDGPDNILELGSFKGIFTEKILTKFHDVTCIEASDGAIAIAKQNPKLWDVNFIHSTFEEAKLDRKYDNIILTHTLEHLDDPIAVLNKIKNEWLSSYGRLFVACPNANAASRQIAVAMGIISNNSSVTASEKDHGHKITYTLDTLERDTKSAGLKTIHRGGIFFKALANFQWDKLLKTDIISKEYLDGCYQLGQKYPDLCSSIFLVCEKGNDE
jgi:2-polyprenyl-3-methyl-5-hydroxy-6-metoxy-1,4-benzoquinol methylase